MTFFMCIVFTKEMTHLLGVIGQNQHITTTQLWLSLAKAQNIKVLTSSESEMLLYQIQHQ